MKKKLIVALILFVLISLMLLVGYFCYIGWKRQSYALEVYECDTLPRYNIVTIKYNCDDSIDFELTTKGENGGILSGAESVADNVWIYDGAKSYPENGSYYKFVISDKTDEGDAKYLELYNKEELIGRYMLIAYAVLEG